MLYYTLVGLSSTYTVLVAVIIIHILVYKWRFGVEALARKANDFARTKTVVAFEVYSYTSTMAWFLLVLPWVDLFTFHNLIQFKDGGMETYFFGWMSAKEVGVYFIIVFFNIAGVKGALNLADIARLLRRGRVRLHQIPGGMLRWIPE